MSATWTATRDGVFRDAYLDWPRLIRSQSAHADHTLTEYEPIFVRLLTGAGIDPQAQRRALLAELAATHGNLLIDAHEHDLLQDRLATASDAPDEYALYRRLGTPDSDHATLFEVLDTGVPVALGGEPGTLAAQQPDIPTAECTSAPIMAVIDDGIGFLNMRFRKRDAQGQMRSRFHGFWLQALESRATGLDQVVAGQVLGRDRIEALFDQPEDLAYASLNAQTYGPQTRASTTFARSHGTHVLDMAAGADLDDASDPVRDWPLLGVQLPPEAIADTSGTTMESYLVQGLRWILQQAKRVNPNAPLIVNISLGFLAGPKDGTRFAEYQLAREAALWEARTKQPVRLVYSFGNNRLGRLVADLETPAAQGAANAPLAWRVQPCDPSPNYLEIRAPGAGSETYSVSVTTPGGLASGFAEIGPGQMRALEENGRVIARIYHIPARDFGDGVVCAAHYVVALAPTEARGTGDPTAPVGAWQVAVQASDGTGLRVVMQIQRDDALFGTRARQSYFDAADAYEMDPDTGAYRALHPDGAITQAGSHSALCTAQTRQTLSVAAAARSLWDAADPAGNVDATSYSGAGSDWSIGGPTVATVTQLAPFRKGRMAAGTLSGTRRRSGGTSAAAAELSRALGLCAETIARNAAAGGGAPSNDLDPAEVTLIPVPAAKSARLGAYVVRLPQDATAPKPY